MGETSKMKMFLFLGVCLFDSKMSSRRFWKDSGCGGCVGVGISQIAPPLPTYYSLLTNTHTFLPRDSTEVAKPKVHGHIYNNKTKG